MFSILLSVDINANKSDQTKNVMILEFKNMAAERALVRTEAPGAKDEPMTTMLITASLVVLLFGFDPN